MKFKSIIPLTLIIAILFCVIFISSKANSKPLNAIEKKETSSSTVDSAEQYDELKGVWITYMELDMQGEADKSETAFRDKFSTIATCCKENGYNTLIVQVRPFCDALYNSKIFPYSHLLTGEQGKNPDYDPLKIICEICRENKLQIHAWVNPYRIALKDTPPSFSKNNPYVKNKSIAFSTDSGIYFDPSSQKAQDIIIQGVAEIVENYDIDAVQFDDYFYPPDIANEDKSSYDAYVKNCKSQSAMSLNEWRKSNVNLLICNTYRKIHSIKPNVDFGISPQGNIDNNDEIFADVKSWCTTTGYIDYICPQIYFSLENPALSFGDALNSWNSLDYAENVKLYIGLAGYKAGTDKDENTWIGSNNILSTEYDILKQNSKSKGFMLYSYNSLISETSSSEVKNLSKAIHNNSK